MSKKRPSRSMMAATVTLGDQRNEAGALAAVEGKFMVLGPFAMEKQAGGGTNA
jgi:hypothetical protein